VRPRALLPALAVLVTLVLTGCGKLDTGKLEGVVKDEIAKDVGVTVQSVDCPSDVEAKKGASFQCTATGEDGTTAAIDVVQQDDKGNVGITAPLVNVPQVEQALGGEIGGGAKLDCPDLVLIEKGASFTCQAKDSSGAQANVVVTFEDDQGNVTYEVNPTG